MFKLILAASASLIVMSGCANKATTTPNATPAPAAKTDKNAVKKEVKKAAAAAATVNADSLVCKNGSEIRSLEIKTENGGCQLAYTKQNQTSNVASAASGTEYCKTVQKRIQTKLLDAGYKCE